MLERLERGMCFYCAMDHDVPGWEPGVAKPPRMYRMCVGTRKVEDVRVRCQCSCTLLVEFPPMQGYSNRGLEKNDTAKCN
jgi:hypothetical protein